MHVTRQPLVSLYHLLKLLHIKEYYMKSSEFEVFYSELKTIPFVKQSQFIQDSLCISGKSLKQQRQVWLIRLNLFIEIIQTHKCGAHEQNNRVCLSLATLQ